MLTYFVVMNDYGIPWWTTMFLANDVGYEPKPTDVYQPFEPNYGNTNYGDPDYYRTVNWANMVEMGMDLRLFYVFRQRIDWSQCRWAPDDEDIPRFWRISPLSDEQICYTTEALVYAQSSYFCAAIIVQIANVIISKTRIVSLAQQQWVNQMLTFGIFVEVAIGVITSYVYWIGIGIGTRPVAQPHFMVPAFTYFFLILLYDEVRKVFLRRGIHKEKGKVKIKGWIARNTFY